MGVCCLYVCYWCVRVFLMFVCVFDVRVFVFDFCVWVFLMCVFIVCASPFCGWLYAVKDCGRVLLTIDSYSIGMCVIVGYVFHCSIRLLRQRLPIHSSTRNAWVGMCALRWFRLNICGSINLSFIPLYPSTKGGSQFPFISTLFFLRDVFDVEWSSAGDFFSLEQRRHDALFRFALR